MDDVILVMAQSDLRATQFLGKVKELLAALPGAEEAGGLLFALARRRTVSSSGTFVGSDFAYVGSGETGGDDVQGDVEVVTERLEVGGVRFLMNILHPNVQGFDGEVGDMNLGTTGKELQQTKGVLTTRQADEDTVVLVDELELSQCFVKSFPKFFFEIHHDVCRYAIATYWTIS